MKNKKLLPKKLLSLVLASSMVVGSASMLSGCGGKSSDIVTLDVYSQLANFNGEQTGWSAKLLKEKFGVKLNIIAEAAGVYETRSEDGDLGDIVVFGNDNDKYPQALKAGLLFDWNEDNTLDDFGPDIKKNMPQALAKNQELTKTITDGASDTLYGFGHNVALSSEDHESFFYTWDLRWDLYKKLGYPRIKDLNDLHKVMKQMTKINPKDDAGNKVYAVSLWPDWDDAMVMYVKATGTAYYGYDELAVGLYDSQTGNYHDALEEGGPYLQMLKWYNDLYQDGLVDPDSMAQTYDEMISKVQSGGVLFSIFNYSGQLGFNTPEHTSKGMYMNCVKPEKATPIVYGMNPQGGDRVWCIGSKSDNPEKAMEVINWLATPEGWMTASYGPKGLCWDYDEDGNTFFTEFGKKCQNDKKTKMIDEYAGTGTYHDGEIQINNTTWSMDARNPDSNGETYNYENWKSELTKAKSDMEQDWRDKTGAVSVNTYMEKSGQYVLAPGTSFSQATKDDTLKTTWSQVTTAIKNRSWEAIYAKSDKEYDKIVAKMKKEAASYGYDKCKGWSLEQAKNRKLAEDAVTKK